MTLYLFLVLLGVCRPGQGVCQFLKCCNAFLISLFEGGSVLMFKSVLAGGILGVIAGGGLLSSSSKYYLHLFSCSFSAVKSFPSLLCTWWWEMLRFPESFLVIR